MTATTGHLANLNGTRAHEDLPHSCGRCDNRWAGANTSHCGACHLTFSAVGSFDKHRNAGRCNKAADVGLVLVDGRAYDCWGTRGESADQ